MLTNEFEQLNCAVQAAGKVILNYFGQILELTHKSTSADFRTKADVEAEKTIIHAIEKLFPNYNILGEEHGLIQKDSEYTFVIDPLDGTNNFVLGVPVFTSSVALMRGKETIYGVINSPINDEIYYALKGNGAFLNAKPIQVNNEARAEHATLSYFCNYVTPRERIRGFRDKISKLAIKRDLDLWAPAFCYCCLASGKIEAIINDQIELYDFAAGKLIAQEAGAKVTDFAGNEFGDDTHNTFVITNGSPIHANIINAVTHCY